jgi:hypothetical protein
MITHHPTAKHNTGQATDNAYGWQKKRQPPTPRATIAPEGLWRSDALE